MMAVPPGCLLFVLHGSVLKDVLSTTCRCVFQRTFLTWSCSESDQLIFISCKQMMCALYSCAAAAMPCHLLVFLPVDSEWTFCDSTWNSLSCVIIVLPQCSLVLLDWRVCCTLDWFGLGVCLWWSIVDWLVFIRLGATEWWLVGLSQLSRVKGHNWCAGVFIMLWVLVLSVSVLYGFVVWQIDSSSEESDEENQSSSEVGDPESIYALPPPRRERDGKIVWSWEKMCWNSCCINLTVLMSLSKHELPFCWVISCCIICTVWDKSSYWVLSLVMDVGLYRFNSFLNKCSQVNLKIALDLFLDCLQVDYCWCLGTRGNFLRPRYHSFLW